MPVGPRPTRRRLRTPDRTRLPVSPPRGCRSPRRAAALGRALAVPVRAKATRLYYLGRRPVPAKGPAFAWAPRVLVVTLWLVPCTGPHTARTREHHSHPTAKVKPPSSSHV